MKGNFMLKTTLLAGATAAALAGSGLALAADAAPASPHTFAANVGLYSQYVFRGLTQTDRDPAVQGGFDYTYNFGSNNFYAGTWLSNISWLKDGGGYSSSSLENDWYAGFKGAIGASDFSYDVGYLYYYYPGTVVAVTGEKGDTQELYGALGWKWFTAKLSYGVGSKTFGVRDSKGTWYLDLSASVPLADSGVTLMAHWGDKKFKGTDARNTVSGPIPWSNDRLYSYKDWKLGATYDMGKASDVFKGTTVGGYWTGTTGATKEGYGTPTDGGFSSYPHYLGKSTFTAFIQKTF
jgi:uncharacterized protein (TIGR02001 family)